MDYMGIIRRAWNTTWRYKILWLFGLFAGAGGSGNNFNWNRGSGSGNSTSSGFGSTEQLTNRLAPYLPLIITAAVFVALLSIVLFVLTFAAQGGLIHLVRENEEGRPIRAGDGWREGFKRWGRVFLIDFLVGLPIILLVIVVGLVFAASIPAIVLGGRGLDIGSASGAAIGALGAGIGGLCFAILLFVVFAIAYSIVFGTVAQLALRYGVLHDMPAVQSLKQGWRDFWGKRGAVLMYLVMWATGTVYGVVVGIVLALIVAPAVVLGIAGVWPAVVGLGVLALALAMVPAAIYGAFSSAAWTIFFRRMTGAEQVAAAVAPTGGYPAAPMPPAPMGAPMPAAPAAPPVVPSPPAPPEASVLPAPLGEALPREG